MFLSRLNEINGGCEKNLPVSGTFRFFIKKCRHDINKLNFNHNTKFSNLSSEEGAALENLSNCAKT